MATARELAEKLRKKKQEEQSSSTSISAKEAAEKLKNQNSSSSKTSFEISAEFQEAAKNAALNPELGASGWQKYLDDIKKAEEDKKQAQEEEKWWQKLGRYLGNATYDTSLPTALTNQVINDLRTDTSHQRPSDDWDEEQKTVFGYLYSTDPSKAYKYAEATNIQMKTAAEEEAIRRVQESATGSFGAGLGHTVGAIATAPLGLADYLNNLVMVNAGRDPAPDGMLSPFEYSQAVTGGITTHLNETGGVFNENIPIIGGKGWGDVYSLGTSIAQNLVSGYTLGGAGTFLSYFGQSGASNVNDALSRGATPEQAILYGTVLGALEGLWEAAGVEHLFKLGSSATVKGFIKNIFKQAGVEGIEEGLTSFTSNIADNAIMQGKSNFNALVAQYTAQGMSQAEAEKKAWLTTAGDIAFDTIAGAVSGGVSGSIHTTAQNIASNKEAKEVYGTGRNLVGEAFEESSEGSKAKSLAENYQKTLDDGKNLSGAKLNRLAYEYNEDLLSQDTTKIKAAVEKRLASLGETGNISDLADIIVKHAKGEKLSVTEQSIIRGSYAGQRVANEITPKNIASGEYTSEWTKDIGTRVINADSYNKTLYDLAMEQAGVATDEETTSATVDSTPTKEIATEAKNTVSDDGKTVLIETGEEVTIQGIASIKNGKVMLRTNKGEVDSKDISFGTDDEALLYEAVTDMSAEAARNMVEAYDPSTGVSMSDYVHGFKDAYKYGFFGFAETELSKGNFTKDLSYTQSHRAYTVGKNAGEAAVKEAQAARTAAKTGDKSAPKKGKVYLNGKEYTIGKKTGLSGIRDTSVKGMVVLAESLGVDVHFYESYVKDGKRVYRDENGNVVKAPHGFYDASGIHIDLNAGKLGEGLILYTAAHELTHFIREWSPAKFKVFADFLLENYGKKGVTIEALVQGQIQKARKNDRVIDYDTAYEEVIADSCQAMLADGKAIQKLGDLKAKDATLWNKIKDFISSIVAKIRKAYEGLDPYSDEGRFVKQHLDVFEQLQSMWIDALVDAGETYSEVRDALGEDSTIKVNEDGEFLMGETSDGKILYNDRTWDEGGREILRATLAMEGYSEEDIKAAMTIMDGKHALVEQLNKEFSEQDKISKATLTTDVKNGNAVLSALVSNGDYPVNIDLLMVCKKRQAYQRVINRLCETGLIKQATLDALAIAEINKILGSYGFETACLGCFVESRRIRIQEWAETICKEWNDIVDKMVGKGKAASFNFAEETFVKDLSNDEIEDLSNDLEEAYERDGLHYGRTTVVKKMEQLLREVPSLRKHLSVADLITPQGRTHLKQLSSELNSLVACRYGSNTPKIVQDFNPYNHELAEYGTVPTKYESLREYLYAIGGARMQSFSDFIVENWFDYCQIVADLAARKLPMHTYTKEIVLAKLFGMTGIKINMSLIPDIDKSMGKEYAGLTRNANGELELIWGDKDRHKATGGKSYMQSINFADALELMADPRYSANVGTIAVGVSDMHIRMMLDDPRIRMIIPYHSSGMNPIFANLVGTEYYTDYTNDQNPTVRLVDGSKNLYQLYDSKGNAVGMKLEKSQKDNLVSGFDFNAVLQELGDARAAAKAYLEWCADASKHSITIKGETYTAVLKPEFEQFSTHENYYKVLEDFNTYDCITEQAAPQGDVQQIYPDEFEGILRGELTVRENYRQKQEPKWDAAMGEIESYLKTHTKKDTLAYAKEHGIKLSAKDKKLSDRDNLTPEQQKNFDYNQKQNSVGSTLKTLKGSAIKRSAKYGVGKEIGGEIYFHKDYAEDILPPEILSQAERLLEENQSGFEYSCLKYNPKTGVVAFQEAPDFDTAREPVVGDYVSVNTNTGDVKTGHSNYIWHHKWNWVKNDYSGFDVEESWNWSKEWLSTLTEVSDGNGIERWNAQLDRFGLPHDGVAHSTRDQERSSKKNETRYSLRDVDPVNPTSDKWSRTHTTAEAKVAYPKLWDVSAEESETRNPTQISQTVNTYRKIFDYLKAEGFDGTILDASSGLGYGTKAGIEEYGFDVEDIEPYPDKNYKPKYTDYSKLNQKYDVIISSFVLNVLPQDQRDALVVRMGELLKDGGRIFVNVRSNDVESLAKTGKNIHLGDMEWIETARGSYQKGFKKSELVAYLQDALGDGYEVAPTSLQSSVAAIVTKKRDGKLSDRDSTPVKSEVKYDDRDHFVEDKYFRTQMAKWEDLKHGSYVKVGQIGEKHPLHSVGMPAGVLRYDVSKLKKNMADHGDYLTVELLKSIPDIIADPVAISEYSEENTVSVFGDVFVGNSPMMVGVTISRDRAGNDISKVRTFNARRDVGNLITDDTVLYLGEDKKRTRKWFQACGIQVPLGETRFGFIRSISQKTDSVKRKFSDRDSYAPVFYSHMGKTIDDIKIAKMGAGGVVPYLKGRGVKDEEIKWSGIEAFLEGKKSVTKEELQEFVAGSQLQIVEQMSGESLDLRYNGSKREYTLYDSNGEVVDTFTYNEFLDGYVADSDEEVYSNEVELREALEEAYGATTAPQWEQYKLDGGSNYRELVFQMPNSSYSNRAMRVHWGEDAEGVLVHARMQDFDTSEGKMLFVEELQSDWHNEGHEKGYTTKEYEDAVESSDKLYDEYKKVDLAFHKYIRSNEFMTDPEDVRKKKHDWLRGKSEAAYEKYLKAKTVVDSLKQEGAGDTQDAPFRDTYHEYVMKRLIRMAAEEGYDIIGWTPSEIQVERWSEKFAEGYRIEYDQDIPKFLRKYGKKWGTTVGKTSLEGNGEVTYTSDGMEYKSIREWYDTAKEAIYLVYGDHLKGKLAVKEEGNILYVQNKETGERYGDKLIVRSGDTEVWSMPITDSMKQSVLREGQPLYSDRSDSDISNRELLANALEAAATNDIERNKLAQYKQKIALINAEEQKLHELKAKIGELSFAKGRKDVEQIRKLQFEAKQAENRINTYDRQLLNLEASAPLKAVLEREKKIAYKKAEKRGKDALAAYREKAAADKRKLLERAAESRLKGIEGRRKTEMRHKTMKVISELRTLLLKPTNKKHIKEELRKSVADALSAINMDTVGAEERVAHYNDLIAKAKDPDVIEALTQSRDRIQLQGDNLKDKLNALQDAYEKIKESEDIQLSMSYQEVILNSIKAVKKEVGDTSIRNMSLEQLEMVYDLYSMIRKTIRDADKLFNQGKFESTMQTAEAVNEEVRKVGDGRYKIPAISSAVQKLWWSLLKPLVAFRKIGSETLLWLYKNLRAGEDIFYVDVSEAQAFIEKQYEKHGFKSWDMKATKQFTAKSGKTFELTLEQMMTLYAYSRREQAHDHIMGGGLVFEDSVIVEKNKLGIPVKYVVKTKDAFNLSEETLVEISNSLTSEQKAFVDEMQAYLSDTMGAKGNEVSMKLLGVKLFKEKFYLPIKSSHFYMNFKPEEAGEVKLKNPSFSKETVDHANNPIVIHNFTDLWAEHINDMSMYHSFVLALEDFTRVYNYKTKTDDKVETMDTKATIESAHVGATNYINNFLKSLNGGVRMDTVGAAEKLTSLAKKGAVLASLSVTIQQPSAIMRAMAYINPKYFVASAPESLNLVKHKQDWEELKKYAPIAGIKEMGRFDVGMGQDTVDWIKSNKTVMNKVEDVLSLPPALMDEITWVSIWNAVKRETVHNHPNIRPNSEEFLKIAGERFTDIISLSQVYDSVFSRSDIMRNKSWIAKALTAFMAEPTTTLNMLYDAHVQGKRSGAKGYLKTASSTVGAVAASIVLNAALKSVIMAMRDDDEDESYAEKYLESYFGELKDNMNPLTLIPIAKDVVSIFRGYDVERMDMALVSDLKNAMDAFDSDTKTNYEKWSGLVGAISAFFGVPVKNVERDIRGLLNTVFSDAEDTTSAGLRNAIEEGWTGESKSNGQQLYEAILEGDQKQIEKIKSRFKNQTAINTAIRKALRENDPRIKEAANAAVNGNFSRYTSLANQIIGEKNFSEADIVSAIKSEINAMTKDDEETEETEDKEVSIYEMNYFYSAVVDGDVVMAEAIREDIIRTAVANGKEREEAEKSFNSTFQTRCRKEYKAGNLSESEAISMLVNYGGKTEKEARSRVQAWAK